jgi:hypothetical protein
MTDHGGTPEPDVPSEPLEGAPPDGDLTCRIVERVAASAGGDVTDLAPLYDVVDPEALERLFRRPVASRAASDLRVRFEYEGHVVVVREGGDVVVRRCEDRSVAADADADADAGTGPRSPSTAGGESAISSRDE